MNKEKVLLMLTITAWIGWIILNEMYFELGIKPDSNLFFYIKWLLFFGCILLTQQYFSIKKKTGSK